jgi:hypothetical protein
MTQPLTIDGRIIFTQVTASESTPYARWISAGTYSNSAPTYSIQRFSFRSAESGDACCATTIETDPYYVLYYNGFRINPRHTRIPFTTFEAACKVADQHLKNKYADV